MGTLLSLPQCFAGSVPSTKPNAPSAAGEGIWVLQTWPAGMGPNRIDAHHLLPWDALEMLESLTSISCQNTCQNSERITYEGQIHRK